MTQRIAILGDSTGMTCKLLEAVVDVLLTDLHLALWVSSHPPSEEDVLLYISGMQTGDRAVAENEEDDLLPVTTEEMREQAEEAHADLIELRRMVVDECSHSLERLGELKLHLVREEDAEVLRLLKEFVAENRAWVTTSSQSLRLNHTKEEVARFERKQGANTKFLESFVDALEN